MLLAYAVSVHSDALDATPSPDAGVFGGLSGVEVTVAYSLFRRMMPPLWATDDIFSIAAVGSELHRCNMLSFRYWLCCDGTCGCERSAQVAILPSSLCQILRGSQLSLFHYGLQVLSAMEHPLSATAAPTVWPVSAWLRMMNS